MSGTTGGAAERGFDVVREALDRFRAGRDEEVVDRVDGSDVRAQVLRVLGEQPSNGYRIVRVLADRADGAPAPGAGAVYPALQLLADEGLATAEEADGRKVWTLTPAGRAAAEAAQERPATAARGTDRPGGGVARSASVARAVAQLAQAAALAAQTGGRDQVAEVVAVVDDARRRIVSILARS